MRAAGPVALLVSTALCVGSWWWAENSTSGIDAPTFAPASERPGFTYRHFLVNVNGKTVARVTGTHYVMELGGTGLAIKDAATGTIVYHHPYSPALSVGEERP